MNNIDIENINKELAKREAANYKWKRGGDFKRKFIEEKSTDHLNEMIENFSNIKKETANEKIKRLVDEAFAEYSDDPEDNMIVLGACNYFDDSRCISTCDRPLKSINFNGFGHRYNKLAYPIGRDFDLEHYDCFERKHVKGTDDEKYTRLGVLTKKIEALLPDIGLDSIEKYWDDNNFALNELWYGVHAITKDYQIVAFVIRNDGMLCDEDSFESFHNKILYKL